MKWNFLKRTSFIRASILGIILIGSMLIHYLHSVGGAKYPSVHAICPLGGLENLWAWLSNQGNVQKIFSGTMVLFFLTIVFALVFRRSFCGNICPFGAIQEMLGRISPGKFKISCKVDKHLSKIKYLVLALSVFMAWYTMTLWLSPYDPWAAFAHIYKGEEMLDEYAVGTAVLIVTLIGSLFVSRFFCRYLCPAGALYAMVGKISPLKIKRDSVSCVNCGICSKKCPVDIEVHKVDEVKSSECISCMECVAVCPGAGTMLSASMAGRKVRPLYIVVISVAIFFGAIFVLDAAGYYTVALPTQQEVVENKAYIQIADLRGSMTIEEGAFYTGIELSEFYKRMEIPMEVPKDTMLKAVVEYVPDYDFHTIKATK